jgi:outer membrane assembly lipoprotein YfiO
MIRGCHRMFVLLAMAVAVLGARPAIAQSPATSQAATPLEPDPALNRAQALLESHHWQAAHDLIVGWLKDHPKAPDRDRAIYLLAHFYYETGDRLRAFYHLDELMDTYPDSKFFFPAMELQYRIADGFLNGYKEKFLGLPILSQTEEAIEMLYRIQERSPGSPLAERALKRTADYYFNTSEFDLAGDAYGAFIRIYPRSPDIPQVRLRQAFSSLAQFRGPHFDATPLIDARAQFRQIQVHYPDLAADANVAGWIDRIDSDLARKAYVTGDLFRRTNQPHGAVFMYRYVIQTYPNSHEADLSRQDLAKMPPALLADPPPPASNADAAATQPTAPQPGASERTR